jgi:2-aminoadipate transaminase
MNSIFSDRITDVPRSFIREILKVAVDPTIISFAGGLPNRAFFPAEEIEKATTRVFREYGRDIFQYGNSEGHKGLREYISERYRQKNLDIPVENILITSGSQQGLDLLGKILINDGDGVIMEEPGYLGAIQAFSIYQPTFLPVPLREDGIDIERLAEVVSTNKPRLMYSVPNFQNPSGISYSDPARLKVAEILRGTKIIFIEDDPYGELRFTGERKKSFKEILPDNTVLLGSFSKTVVPGFRIGWVAAPGPIMEKLVIAKQATDLHTSHFTQSIIYWYLKENDVTAHISLIRQVYGRQCQAMLDSIGRHFPAGVTHTKPEGGMFLWAELPGNLSALELFEMAVKDRVVFVPGDPFYINKMGTSTMRLNFSCVDEKTIDIGIERLGHAIRRLLERPESDAPLM